MFQKFILHGQKNQLWKPEQKILLAVSGGVDSMVLLHFMLQLAKKQHLKVGVAHVDHQLRKESSLEAEYIRNYCKQQEIVYYEKKWSVKDKKTNTEARARKFRYDFFNHIMESDHYDTLMTAHHSDDQAETVLMKLVRGSALSNLVGIREIQPFGGGKLIRPFLIFSKDDLKEFAEKSEIVYFEDKSNYTNDYTRNRIRNKIVPVLKEENQQFLTHIEQFSQQISFADQIIQSVIEPKYRSWVSEETSVWKINLTELKNENENVQYFFFILFFQKTLINTSIEVNQAQVQQLLQVVNQAAPQKTVVLGKGWQFIKNYEVAYVQREEKLLDTNQYKIFLSESIFLSDTEWLSVESMDKIVKLPIKVDGWKEHILEISTQVELPLTIRHRKNGDRLKITSELTKKIGRIFIDKKVSNSDRERAWLIFSNDGELIWVPGFGNSYLSIRKETDKMFYRIRYRSKD